MASQDNIACSCTSLKNSIASVIITVNCNNIMQILQKNTCIRKTKGQSNNLWTSSKKNPEANSRGKHCQSRITYKDNFGYISSQ